MSHENETFFTVVGCMDGRVQEAVAQYGKEKFGAQYPDTITEAGIVGKITTNPTPEFVEGLKFKLGVSLDKHGSKGIVIDGHEECAGNPVDDDIHKIDVKTSVGFVQNLIENRVPVVGVFVIRDGEGWKAEEI